MTLATTRPRTATRCLPLIAAVLVLISGCALVGSDRSTEKFCEEYEAANARMEANVTGTSSDEQLLGGALLNIGEMTRLIHRLDQSAPDEIKSEMSDVRKQWDSQSELASQSPLGGLAQAFISSVMNGASVRAVETYSKANCGKTLFGGF